MYDELIAEAPDAVIAAPEPVAGLALHVDGDYLGTYHGAVDIPIAVAKENTLNMLRMFAKRVGATSTVVHSTAPGCHKGERYLVATVKPYQAQRSKGDKPANIERLRAWLRDYQGQLFINKTWAFREADDGMGACALFGVKKDPGYIALATADKDMRMLPGVHINWKEPQFVTRVMPGDYDVIGEDGKQYGLKWFWLQMLMGDTADHIPGLEYMRVDNPDGTIKGLTRVGPKAADKLLADAKTTDEAGEIVIKAYARGYVSNIDFAMDRFVEQACLLWMRTDTHGTLCDFATHDGPSRINGCFNQPVWDAVERLTQRVTSARQQINSRGG